MTRWRPPKLIALPNAALGLGVGLLAAGSLPAAGAVGIVGLPLLYPRMPITGIVGSDIAHAVPLTLLAGVGH